MFCASCGRKIEPRGNTYQHTTEMPKMSLYEDDFDMEEERKGKSSSSSVPVIIAIIIAVCLLITAGVAAWFLLNHRTDTSSDNSVSNELKTELNQSTNKKIKEEKESKKKKEDADKAKKEDSEKEEETKEEAEAEEKTDNYILPDSSKRVNFDWREMKFLPVMEECLMIRNFRIILIQNPGTEERFVRKISVNQCCQRQKKRILRR